MIDYFILLTPVYVSFFWSIALFSRKLPARQFLSVFMLTVSILYFGHALYFYQNYAVFTWYDALYTLASLSVYPMFYIYLRLLTFEQKFQRKHYKHFITPLIFFLIILGSTILMSKQERLDYYGYTMYSFPFESTTLIMKVKNIAYVSSRIVFSIQVLFYLFMSIRVLRQHSKQIREYYSNVDEKALLWIKTLIVIFAITSFSSIFINIISKEVFMQNFNMLIFPSLLFSCLLFMIGYSGLKQKQIATEIMFDKKIDAIGYKQEIQLSDNEIINNLKNAFELNMLHLDPDLKIWDVCLILKVSRLKLTNALSNELGCDFSFYVNKIRSSEVQKIISKGQAVNLTELVKKTGFDSQNAMIREYKKHYGKNLLSIITTV
ncbi:MAG: hypothetical protein PHI36_05890 [Bacteroidales bacterium]|nr:hypothetical protein [Bacteroidales bacterium]